MGNLLAYSGIATKVKAMKGHLITDEQFKEIGALETVPEAVDYLKHHPAYSHIFSDLDDSNLHRGIIEERLTLSEYHDFTKLYRFANQSQRKFLSLYFMHYEVAILKRCLRNTLNHQTSDIRLSAFQVFFEKHSKLDLARLTTAPNLTEFINSLEGSPYHDLLSYLNLDKPTSFDYEAQLDFIYLNAIWKMKDKYLSRAERAVLTQCFGTKLDMLNIQWIYRSKNYYHMPPAAIYALLIPNSFHLSKDELTNLVEAATIDEFYSQLETTYYGKVREHELARNPNLEELYVQILNRIHKITYRKDPYSIASLNMYLYFKELEIQKIITVIEHIRYGLKIDR